MGCKVSRPEAHPRPTAKQPEQRPIKPDESLAVCAGQQPDAAQPKTLQEARAAGLKAKKELEEQKKNTQINIPQTQTQNPSKAQNKTKRENLFEDAEFPATLASLTNNKNHASYNYFKDAVWRRPDEFLNCLYDEIKVFDTIDINDIAQGILGDCYFLAAISGLAEIPQRIQQLFPSPDVNKTGKYSVRFFEQGVPKVITVDDQFPCYGNNQDVPLFSRPQGKELWAILLEKAWAKFFKGYTNAESGYMYEALENLTGAPSFHFDTTQESEDQTWTKIKNADLRKFVIGASSQGNAKERDSGVAEGHAYTVVSVHEVGGHRLFKLRNPWGKFEWNGDFSDSSPLWTDQMKKALQYENADNGVFFIPVKDFRIHFREYTIHQYDESWQYSYVQAKSNCKHANYYKFSVNKPCEAYFRVHQRDKRHVGSAYEYSPVNFMITKMEKDGSSKLVFDSNTRGDPYQVWGARSVLMTEDGKVELKEAGDYIIRVKVNWKNASEDTYTVSSYSSAPLTLQQIPSVKDFLMKYLCAVASQNKRENKLTETSACVSEHHKNFSYTLVKNSDNKELNVNITFKTLNNLRIAKQVKHSQNKVSLKIPAKSNQLIFLKMINSTEACNYDWDWEFL